MTFRYKFVTDQGVQNGSLDAVSHKAARAYLNRRFPGVRFISLTQGERVPEAHTSATTVLNFFHVLQRREGRLQYQRFEQHSR